jgi:hypothetical protein
MDRDPALRFQSAEELRRALLAWRPEGARAAAPPPAARTMPLPSGFELPAPPPARDEPPEAPTQLWPGHAATPAPAMLTPVGDGRPSAVGVTQQTWDKAPSSAPKRSALLAVIGLGAAVGVGGIVAFAMLGNHETAPAPTSAASAVVSASAAEPTATAAASASASAEPLAASPASAAPTASTASTAPSAAPSTEPATTAHPSHTTKPKPAAIAKPASAPPTTPKTGGKVVTDYGY